MSTARESLIQKLEKFRFNRMEALVYISLLAEAPLNGSQIAKILGVPRTSVYDALENLSKRGAVFLSAGEASSYLPQDAVTLISALERELAETAGELRDELAHIEKPVSNNEFWNIQGESAYKDTVRGMIAGAQSEILMNTDYSLEAFSKEIREATDRGVRFILFSFAKLDVSGYRVEFQHNPNWVGCDGVQVRMMLVTDLREALIANGTVAGNYSGTFSTNRLLVSIVAEHIHHDIYMYKIGLEKGGDAVRPDMLLKSLMEQSSTHKTGLGGTL